MSRRHVRARPKKNPRRENKSRVGVWTAVVLLLLVGAYVAALEISRPHVSGDRLRIDSFLRLVEAEKIKSAHILDADSYVVGRYQRSDGAVAEYNSPMISGSQSDIALGVLVPARVPTTVDQQVRKRIAAIALLGLPALMLVVLFAYMILSYRRGSGLFSVRSGARKVEASEVGVSFDDVAGHDDAVGELRELKEFLTDPERFAKLGAQVPKGVLLFGPPGCGKTMLARALANEASASFYSISGSDFVEVYVGVGASRVRDLFKEARQNAPALVFIDELDSIGRARPTQSLSMGSGEQEQALNQVLAEMDGFSSSEGIIVLGASNRPDVLDKALLRPGRFDRSIGLALPDEEARLAILTVHARTKAVDPGVDLAPIAREAIGLSGADLASVMNEGALLAARAARPAVTQIELERALHHILSTPERQRRLSQRANSIGRRYTEKDRTTFADVGGQTAAVAELQEIKDFLAHPERFAAMGSEIPRGVLLYGPPGCGKTLMARALAGEANAAFFSVTASEFVEAFVGMGASRVRDLFAEARSMPPAIVFIDEMDAIGRARGGTGPLTHSHGSEQEQALNQLLAEIDGIAPAGGLIVLAATNRPDTLDPALLRPGRFDRSVGLALPDDEGRLAILTLHAAGKRLAAETDFADLAKRAIGLSGADLANVMNEAGILAVRAGREAISQSDLDQALQRVLRAPSDQRRLAMRGRSIGRRYAASERVTFADVAGVDDAIAELDEVRHYLADPARFARMGARIPRGILMSGPPGCGKTLLARAVAGEANAAFFSVAGSEFVEVFVGQGAARVRDLFGEAKSMSPAILFIDEIDAIGGHRTSQSTGGNQEREQTLNQMLVELDGFEANNGLIVMAATNRRDMLDAALIRPGRFDRHVTIRLPDRAGRLAILNLHARDKRLRRDVDLGTVSALTQGFSGADLANVLNEAALLAARMGAEELSPSLIDEGTDRTRAGVVSRGTVMTFEERTRVAYHESGHGLVALAVPGADAPHKLTIVPRGEAMGRCTTLGSHDRVMYTRSELIGRMATFLGGAVAEELVFGESSTGQQDDLRYVGELARRMVREFGMSSAAGLLAYPVESSDEASSWSVYSEESARMIDNEARRLVDEAASLARSALTREALDRVASVLLDRETLDVRELVELVSPPAPTVNGARKMGARSRF